MAQKREDLSFIELQAKIIDSIEIIYPTGFGNFLVQLESLCEVLDKQHFLQLFSFFYDSLVIFILKVCDFNLLINFRNFRFFEVISERVGHDVLPPADKASKSFEVEPDD